ncbi:hypothetical protein NQ176_g6315 [Zarea fungicola]|uniref:Uncharacterized protein n=1 Tax=Zarea fungicola TaxID=93591 RepID=A0ACC1N3X8_9HYPO|nr:hypothetical protein NQ176_g6315 [Lecanicillium fungicola]
MSAAEMDPAQLTQTHANEFGERFTRSILAKHFRHSNMASFVRQLNKYDFHKVKPPAEANGSTSTSNVLELRHPYFRADRQSDLDNIRRKAPVPRKTQMIEEFITSQFVGVISEQLAATQQQVQQLQDRFAEVSGANRCLFNQVLALRKSINAQKAAQHEILNYLVISDARINAKPNHPIASTGIMTVSDGNDSASELRKAWKLLTDSVTDSDGVVDCKLEEHRGANGAFADTRLTTSQASQASPASPVTASPWYDPIVDLNRYPVYPVGQTVGIDPFASENMQKLPYALPDPASATDMLEEPHREEQQQMPKSFGLYRTNETTTLAPPDGAEACARISAMEGEPFDMIFMDIIMPRLDGVSASMYIRRQWPLMPIVAMTSSIRPDEVNQYFKHGINGILAKPFTKEGILQSLKTHLPHLLNPVSQVEADDSVIKPAVGFMNGLVPTKLEQHTAGSVHAWSDNGMRQARVEHSHSMEHGAIELEMGEGSQQITMHS